jgi:hypothetical protein
MASDFIMTASNANVESPVTKLHVNSFYGNSMAKNASASKTVQMCNSIDKCKGVPEKQPQKYSSLRRVSGTQMQYLFCKKLLQKRNWQHKHGTAMADRRPKTVERQIRARTKQAASAKPLTSTHQYQLMFSGLENSLGQSESGKEQLPADSKEGLTDEKENRAKEDGIKRFFKTRTDHSRKHVTSVDGKFISMENLSCLSSSSSRNRTASAPCYAKCKSHSQIPVTRTKASISGQANSVKNACKQNITSSCREAAIGKQKNHSASSDESDELQAMAHTETESEQHSAAGFGSPLRVVKNEEVVSSPNSSSVTSARSQTLMFSPRSSPSAAAGLSSIGEYYCILMKFL